MKVISKKPLIHITPEEEKALQLIAELFNEIIALELPQTRYCEIDEGQSLLDWFFNNDGFNCEVTDDGEE